MSISPRPGVDLAAALDRGLVTVRGTSFAAPIAAGLLARRLSAPDPAAAAEALAALGQEAVDLGSPGPDPVYGRGLVGADVRVVPACRPEPHENKPRRQG
jgi:subtilisin family serine protease